MMTVANSDLKRVFKKRNIKTDVQPPRMTEETKKGIAKGKEFKCTEYEG